MGIMPDPGTFNNNCPLCFPVDETPEFVKMFVSGIEKSVNFPHIIEPAPNGYVDLSQTGWPCEWTGSRPGVHQAVWHQVGGETCVTVDVLHGLHAFGKCNPENCSRYFVNHHQNPAVFAYNFGYVYISTPAEIQRWIAMALPVVGPDPRMELFPMEDRQIVIRFANIQDGTNIKLRLDVDDLP